MEILYSVLLCKFVIPLVSRENPYQLTLIINYGYIIYHASIKIKALEQIGNGAYQMAIIRTITPSPYKAVRFAATYIKSLQPSLSVNPEVHQCRQWLPLLYFII